MNILITGATSGIGYSFTLEFIKKGHRVFGVGRNVSKLLEIKELYGEHFVPLNYDVSVLSNIDNIFHYLSDNNIQIDILVNNAGIGNLGKFTNSDFTKHLELINLNISALTYFSYKFLKEFESYHSSSLKNNNGLQGIINVSSTGAYQEGGSYFSTYYASKSFVKSFTNALSQEYKNRNFNVMCLLPGPTKSNFVGMSASHNFYIMEPSKVVSIAIKDFYNRKNISIPGIFNKILVFIGKFIPRKLELKLVEQIQLKKLKNNHD